MILALPPLTFLYDVQDYKFVEIGSGTGLWLRIFRECGLDIIGYDRNPRGPDVIKGDHTNLAKHPDRVALFVWPDDMTIIDDWLNHYAGTHVIICGNFDRFRMSPLPVIQTWKSEGGRKGTSQIKLMEIPR